MTYKQFCVNLSIQRSKQNLCAHELSLMIGKNAGYINRIENGKLNPSLKVILEIANALEISTSLLFKEDN